MTESTDHKQKMQERQAEQRAKVAELRDPERGLVLVHTGAGKGKTSSAMGVVIRAIGWKQRVGVVQFIKGKFATGEEAFFRRQSGVEYHVMGQGFTWETQDRGRDEAAAHAAWEVAGQQLRNPEIDLVVLDELNIVLKHRYLAVADVINALADRPEQQHVVITGRNAPPDLIEVADTVSDVKLIKHAFQAGVKAQKGVEL